MIARKPAQTLEEILAGCDDRPRDRPRGAPTAALYKVACICLLSALVPDTAWLLFGAEQNSYYFALKHIGLFFPLQIVIMLAVMTMTALGKRKGVFMMYWGGYGIMALYLANLIAFLWLSTTIFFTKPYHYQAGTALIMAAVFLAIGGPMVILGWNGLRHIRWLDPNSLPHEWEISTRSDPEAPAFCDQPLDPAQKAVQIWNEKHGIPSPKATFSNPYPTIKSASDVPSIVLAWIAPWLVQYRLGNRWMALLAAVLCLGAVFFLLAAPIRAPFFWLIAAGPAVTSAKLARDYWEIKAMVPDLPRPVMPTRRKKKKL